MHMAEAEKRRKGASVMESNQPLQNKTKAVRRQKIFRNIIMILLCLISLIPFYLMFVNATRTSTQVQSGISLLFGSNLKNNIANFDKSQQGLGVTVLQSMFNSFKVAVPFTVLSVYFSSMTAYGIHNYSFKGRKAAWAFIMGVMMVPTQVFAIGFYQFMMKLNLLDTYWPLIIPGRAALSRATVHRHLRAGSPDRRVKRRLREYALNTLRRRQ